MLLIYKFLIIILLLIIFYYVINVNIECFVGSSSSNKNYTNTNEYPSFTINSNIPYDIKLNNDKNNYYDYGNDEIEAKFAALLKIDYNKIITAIEGSEWSEWIKDDNYPYYNQIIIYLQQLVQHDIFTLPNDKNKFKIIKHSLVRYKKQLEDKGILLLEIDIIIYRENKPLARHMKFLIKSNGVKHNIAMAKVVGVINECNLKGNYETYDKNDYQEFNPEFKYKYDMNSFLYDTNDKLLHSEIEYNIYNKILKEL
uniref:Uncharacterized protein n=1 Tax=viral metagenome TaxID=1070528 RepID=A0A6C0LI48_9ZZZZ